MTIASTALLADMWDTNGHMGGGWWIVMMFGMFIFWAAVIVGIVWLVRGGASDSWRTTHRDTAREVLDRRFAEGTISEDEYLERREVIAHGSARPRSEPQDLAPQ